MIHKEFIIHSTEGEKLRADLRYEPNGKPKPAILFLHGFKGFKNWGPYPAICELLAASGFVSIAFNFSHNGVGDDLTIFTELDRFAENTFSRECDELSDVINELEILSQIPIEKKEIQNDFIGILGHSRGGSIAILEAPRHRAVRAVAAWSPPAYLNRYTERQHDDWRKQGYFDISNTRTGQSMRINVSLLEDIEKNSKRLDILHAASQLTNQEKFLLLAAGSEDMTIPPKEPQEIYERTVKEFSELHIISNTGHTFGAEHPNPEIPSPMEEALKKTIAFFQKYLIVHPVPYPE